ncbi:MAG: alpha/beta-hydrolase family protein [Micropruina sp.]|uniref:alpha/beta hydrolase n=1 Tax=Micropruina sp. TaxID=2737536 RepID=UPI0039E6922F
MRGVRVGAWSGVGLVLGLAMFLVSFAPSLLPRQWLWQGLVGGFSAATGYLVGYLLEMTADAIMRLLGIEVQVSWHQTGGFWILVVLGAAALAIGWWWSVREHRETARLVGMPQRPAWHDIAATAVALATMVVLMLLIRGIALFTTWVTQGLDLFLPSVLSIVGALVVAIIVVRMVNKMVFNQALERVSRQADKLDRRRPRGLRAPQLSTRSGSPGAVQSWDELGRRGQIFTSCGPGADDITAVIGWPAVEPIRIYASLGDGGVEEAVELAMAEVRRTGALERGTLVLDTPAGRGWVDEFSVQAVEYLTAGDCATVSVQYSKLASAFVFLADPETPRACARALFAALDEAIADLPPERRPKVYTSGESLGSYGGHGAFVDADDMLAQVDGALWIGTPGFTEICRDLTRSRMRGSPEITPVIDNGRHIRFVTTPTELVADAFGRPLGEWEAPRVVYIQHASDPMCRFTGDLAWREPDWMRERAGSDVNGSLRWWPLVTWFQISTDMLTSMDTPAGHGHIYEDELVPLWAAVLGRTDAPVTAITAAIRSSVDVLKRPLSLSGSGNSGS